VLAEAYLTGCVEYLPRFLWFMHVYWRHASDELATESYYLIHASAEPLLGIVKYGSVPIVAGSHGSDLDVGVAVATDEDAGGRAAIDVCTVYALKQASMSGDLLYDRAPRLPAEHFAAFTDGAEVVLRLEPKLVISIIERGA